MNKKTLVIVIAFSIIMIGAVLTPTLAHNDHKNPPATDSMKSYGTGGYVLLQLPSPSTPSHPYNIRLGIRDFDARSINGKEDYLSIYVWCTNFPGGSRFVWIGGISDSQAGIDFVEEIYTGYVGAVNHIKVEDNELKITKQGDVLTVNLTKAIKFEVGDPWPQHLKDLNFTLPAMTLQFRGFDQEYKVEDAPATLAPPASGAGWIIEASYLRKPAWIETSIPAWYATTIIHSEGYINMKFVETWTPPTT